MAEGVVKPTPFRVSVPDAAIEDLKQRLENTRFPGQLEGIGWDDGTEKTYLQELLQYWRQQYNWRHHEALLNSFPQYTLPVNGQTIHFIHAPSSNPGAVPLLLLHGWPGSFYEFLKLLPLLQEAGDFHVVVPSLPGYGWSSPPTRRGCNITSVAATLDALMSALGYSRYVAQGGDWGAIACRALAVNHRDTCVGIHINMPLAMPSLSNPLHLLQLANALLAPSVPLLLSAQELQALQDIKRFQEDGAGYQKIQGTKPQTLAYGLTDSPAGLAAWIVEKFGAWGDCREHNPETAFSRDELLTNISIYWFSGCIASSIRLYKETLSSKEEMSSLLSVYTPTPTGIAIFPKEIFRPPRSWVTSKYNVVQWSEFPRGGHFAALEQPADLAADVARFATKVWQDHLQAAQQQGLLGGRGGSSSSRSPSPARHEEQQRRLAKRAMALFS